MKASRRGLRLADQGVDKFGAPDDGYMPGMDIRAALTVVGDGPVGAVGQQPRRSLRHAARQLQREWALGMKFVVDLPEHTELEPGHRLHTFGYPEPEIFGFLYVHPERRASVGIFVPSWLGNPVRTAYRYLQYFMLHPFLWRHLKGDHALLGSEVTGRSRACTASRSLAGDGFARIGEGCGSTNVLTGSGVDEAWTTGTQLAEGVLELLKAGKPFTRENLEAAYVARRRESWVEKECAGRQERPQRLPLWLCLRTGWHGAWPASRRATGILASVPRRRTSRFSLRPQLFPLHAAASGDDRRGAHAARNGTRALHDTLIDCVGWPAIPSTDELLVTQQDALLMGGKVQAAAGFADHVLFRIAELCALCDARTCISMCCGQAITGPRAPRQPSTAKSVSTAAHVCGTVHDSSDGRKANVEFRAGAGGLHSAETKNQFRKEVHANMANIFHIVVCGGIVPDPLQTLEPGGRRPTLKNEMMLPAVLDPWAASASMRPRTGREASRQQVWLLSLGPKAKLQQVMMTVAQKVPFELVAVDGPLGGFTDALRTAAALAEAMQPSPDSTARGCCCSAAGSRPRAARVPRCKWSGERLGIAEQFQGVDQITVARRWQLRSSGAHRRRQASGVGCAGPPAVLGWATGNLPEPRNNPQVGMANMRGIMPALQKAKTATLDANGLQLSPRSTCPSSSARRAW